MEDQLLRDRLTRSKHLSSLLASPRRAPELFRNPLNHRIDIAHYVEVPEPQNATTIGAQKRAPAFVSLFLLCVLRSIDFDDQVRFQANEIDEERTN